MRPQSASVPSVRVARCIRATPPGRRLNKNGLQGRNNQHCVLCSRPVPEGWWTAPQEPCDQRNVITDACTSAPARLLLVRDAARSPKLGTTPVAASCPSASQAWPFCSAASWCAAISANRMLATITCHAVPTAFCHLATPCRQYLPSDGLLSCEVVDQHAPQKLTQR